MRIENFPPLIMMCVVCIFAGMMMLVVGTEVLEAYQKQSLDPICFRLEEVRYCESFGMELGSIVVTPAGLFGGKPYNKEACVSENSEKIIEFKELNWKICS